MSQEHRQSNPVIVILLSAILLTLVSLVLVVAWRLTHEPKIGPRPRNGTGNPVDPPLPRINDPDRIRQTLRTGRTYQVTLKAGFTNRAEDKDWGIRQVTNLTYEGEMRLNRTIEQNDGHRIVELRHFVVCRNVKVLCEVEQVEIELGLPGVLLLGAIDYLAPGTASSVIAAKPVVEAILGAGAQVVANDAATKAFASVDNLSGKQVRITYVDGSGVTSIVPVDCILSPEEKDFLNATAVLSDCYLFPDLKVKVGGTWSVDGGQLIGLLDPSLKGVPRGDVTIVRDPDLQERGQSHAQLRIDSGLVVLDQSDDRRRRVGAFTPRGMLKFSWSEGYVETAELQGDFTIDEVSKDHLLFEASFKSQPRMEVNYSCRMLD